MEQTAGAAAPRTGSSGDKRRLDAPEGIIRSESSSRSRRPPNRIIQGQVAADAPDWITRGRTRRSGHNPQDWNIRGKVARRLGQECPGRIQQEGPPPSGQERIGEGARSEGNIRPRPRWNSDGDMFGSSTKDYDMAKQRNSDGDEAEEMQCDKDEAGAAVKHRSSLEEEAVVMQRYSHEGKAVAMQRNGVADEAVGRQ